MKPLELNVDIKHIDLEILKDLYEFYKEKYGRRNPNKEIEYILDYVFDTKLIYLEMEYLLNESEIFIDTTFNEEIRVLTYDQIKDKYDVFSNIGEVYDYTRNNIIGLVFIPHSNFYIFISIEKDDFLIVTPDKKRIHSLKIIRSFKKDNKRYIKKDS